MARNIDSAKRVINGTFGRCELNGRKLAETTGLQLKVNFTKRDINLCGQMMTDTKRVSAKGTGSVTLYKVDSGLLSTDGVNLSRDTRHTIISELDDPDSYGAERIAVLGVSFDDLTLADWKAATEGTITAPFTYTGFKLLDLISAE